MMGCSPGDNECDANEKPAHQVTISTGFRMGQTTVTVGAWKRFRGAAGAAELPGADNRYLAEDNRRKLNESAANDNLPAVSMTWGEARGHCEWSGGRLPTEAEWEYAARAGSTGARYGNPDDIAWYGDNTGNQRIDNSTALFRNSDMKTFAQRLFDNGNGPRPVALKSPNGWGLYDMLGNVVQWTADWNADYAEGNQVDPQGPQGGEYRVVRGAGWLSGPKSLRISYRFGHAPDTRWELIGVRCVGE